MSAPSPPDKVIAEAAYWLTKLREQPLTSAEQQQLQAWCARSTDHQRVWQKALRLVQSVEKIPDKLGLLVLNREQ